MNRIIKIGLIMLILDAIWLSVIGTSFLRMVTRIQKSQVCIRFLPVIFVYISLITLYIVFFPKKENKHDIQVNLSKAFIIGFCIYSVYDLTNLAIFNEYEFPIALKDMTWGGMLFALTRFLDYKL